MKPSFMPNGGFLGASSKEDNGIVLLGAPLDHTVSYRPGTRFGPEAIRAASQSLETYSPYLKKDLDEVSFCDLGDLELPPGNMIASLTRIEEAILGIAHEKKMPFVLGGEHLLTFGVVRALKQIHPDLVVVQFDAHTDLRDEYMGMHLSHATVMRRVLELGVGLQQFGIRSGQREEFEFGDLLGSLHDHLDVAPIFSELQGKPVYLSLDIDVLDPAYAPGTGTPEPGGFTTREVLTAIHKFKGQNVVGFDLVELSPLFLHDPTAVLCAKLVREALLTFG